MRALAAAAFLAIPALSGAQAKGSFAEGEELFMRNKPADAVAKLESALREDPSNVQASLYLGIVYSQLSRWDDAVDLLRKVLPRAGEKTALVAYNLGNAYFAKGAATFADQFYSKAVEADPLMASAYLNRGNSRLRTGVLKEAAADYAKYLELQPNSPKRPEIEKLLSLLGEHFAQAEREKAQAEETARAEEEKRKKLLDEVASSLQAAAEDTRGLSSGSEDVMQYDGEFVLQ